MKSIEDVEMEFSRMTDHWEETDPLWKFKWGYVYLKLVPMGSRTYLEWPGLLRQAYIEASRIINGTRSTLN